VVTVVQQPIIQKIVFFAPNNLYQDQHQSNSQPPGPLLAFRCETNLLKVDPTVSKIANNLDAPVTHSIVQPADAFPAPFHTPVKYVAPAVLPQ